MERTTERAPFAKPGEPWSKRAELVRSLHVSVTPSPFQSSSVPELTYLMMYLLPLPLKDAFWNSQVKAQVLSRPPSRISRRNRLIRNDHANGMQPLQGGE